MGIYDELARKGYLGSKAKVTAEAGKKIATWDKEDDGTETSRKKECEEGETNHANCLKKKIK